MILQRLSDENRHHFSDAFALYESAFPEAERRNICEQERALTNPNYHFDLILEGDILLGVMLYWETDEFVFLEHFATKPEIRGKGVGASALNLLIAKGKTVLLEIEPPINEITNRRYDFYKRSGFVMNPYYHIQAKYHLGDEDLELKILSYPEVLTEKQYRDFYEYMTREIGIQANRSSDITVRGYRDGDDMMQIAKLIYLTDPYIYPWWFDTIEDGQKVIAEMIKLPTLYAKENLTVAVTNDGFIAGIVVGRNTPFCEDKAHINSAFEHAGIKRDERTDRIYTDYYAKMGDASDGFYIANIAVDEEYRRRGIAASMIEYVLHDKELCSLESVIANAGSWRLYQRLGFKIAYEYPGVFDIPCYKMIYNG